jgi:hypothetical protein
LDEDEAKKEPQQKSDSQQKGVTQRIPFVNLMKILICFLAGEEGNLLDDEDKKLFNENYLQIFREAWPDIHSAVFEKEKMIVKFGFVKSYEKAMQFTKKLADELNANVVLQTKYLVIRHPTKGKCNYRITLIIFLESDPTREKVVLLVDSIHRIIPEI